MAVVLLIKTEDGEVSEVPVLNKLVIGRSSTSDFKVLDSNMSGKHCSFEIDPKGQLLFKDLGSTNGSFLNNSQIQQTVIRINDVVKVGNTQIRIDEKRLSPSDKLVIGIAPAKQHRKERDKTLPSLNRFDKTAVIESEKPMKKERPNQGAKELSKKESEIPREKSSGETKFLKLENATPKKKRKN
jgi:pSer/pThr/pTyr-binding forkhead associated (FHA) protein